MGSMRKKKTRATAARPSPQRTQPRRAQPRQAPRSDKTASGTEAVTREAAAFPVVALGASAGGLEAFRAFLAALPPKSGLAFILVQHLDPAHASMMAEILSAHTTMAVVEAAEGMPIEPDRVYVIPPGRYLAVRNGATHLSLPQAHEAVRMSFDVLLQSLAEEFGERAVCVILSGTGTDGSVGAKAIKEAGGLVIAQDPDEAEYDGMPRNAIATGAADLILPLEKIPESLGKYARHEYLKRETKAAVTSEPGMARIIDLLRRKTPHDFSLYREGTVGRRIERRMALAGIEDADHYFAILNKDPTELQRLAYDLLINVTRFFRDGKVFEVLAQNIIPELVRAQPEGPIRIWVPGCSTGEEAYSIAMLFLEQIAAAQRSIKLQVFATDVDEDAVAFAREGLYPEVIEADVPTARLSRFFAREERGYRVSRDLRSAIVFSVHDLLSDAPFSRLDLVSCRNLLIYLRPEVQEKVLSLFHFALREGGVLFLGTSESVGAANRNFEPLFKKQKIYRHVGRSWPGEVELPLGRGAPARAPWVRAAPVAAKPHRINLAELTQRLLLSSFAPASVLVNRKRQGLYYFGPIDRYLKLPAGEATQDLLLSAREGLRPAIATALEKLEHNPEDAVDIRGRVNRNGSAVAVTVSARPMKNEGEGLVLLSFQDMPKRERPFKRAVEPPADTSRVAQLEEDLDATRKDLERAVHDREAAEEELRAVNEEAMSVNEEYQTTNEELETSKEELQSLNEELTALNSQLQETLDQHKTIANDLENILNSADVATLFLDSNFKIRFFTPAAKSLFSVIASDVGRPLADLARHFADGNVLAEAQGVLENLIPVAREIEGENGKWYNCRILPYRTKDNRIEGIVITFSDITVAKRAEEVLNAAKQLAESANLGKTRFLAAASHDLRQPLQTLSLLQGLLAKKVQDKEGRDLVARTAETLTAMSGMLNTLLDINQLEAGVVRPEIIDFPINELLERLKAEFVYHTQTHGLEWRVLPCRSWVRSDPRMLEQMLRNLLSNAVKYTAKGGVLLGCRRRGDKLCIEVWDTGLGIPQDQLRTIFEEFRQVGNVARELRRGLGLGLAIVQRLGDLLGHTVDVRSRESRGSVFAVEVPLAPAGVEVASREIERAGGEAPARRGSILVVEDDPGLRDTLELLLREEGHQPTSAGDGQAAIDLVARHGIRPDLVIVDHNLPRGMSGLQVLAQLHQMLGHDLPGLVLTGDISTETLGMIARQGYVSRSKPVSAADLTRLIQSMLAKPT
jgi:two-component system, chemotaxis family, CheB/CheR fusion protein